MAETSATYTIKTCDKCEDGYIYFEKDGRDYVAECDCLKHEKEQRRLHNLFKSAKVPERYIDKSLDNFIQFRQPEAFKTAKSFLQKWDEIKKTGRGIIFVGDVGTGKTHLSFAVFNDLVRRGVNGLAVTVPDLMDDIRPRSEEKQSEQIETLKEIDLLLLDDLGRMTSIS